MNRRLKKPIALFTSLAALSATAVVLLTAVPAGAAPNAPAVTVFQANNGGVQVSFTGDGLSGATFAVSCTSTTGGSFTKSGLNQNASPVAVKGMGTDAPLSAPGVTPVVYNVVTCNVTETSPSLATGPAGTGNDSLIQTSGPGCQPSGTVAAPTNISAAAQGFPGAVVSWAPVATDCLVGYLVTPSSGKAVLVLGPGTTTVMQGPYAFGILIQFTVAAVTGAGVGPASVGVGVTIGTPAAPQAVTASHAAKGAIKVAFKAGANNGAAITALTATCGGHSASGKTSPLIVKGLTAGTSYHCTVAATNSRGTGASARYETVTA